MNASRQLLFICTGNFYRSRYAEALFNWRMRELRADWSAFSRGLMIEWAEGDLSPHTETALQQAGIPLDCTGPTRIRLTEADFEAADRTIALKKAEHYAMMKNQFPLWADRIEYWEVHDLDGWMPHQALPAIAVKVEALVEELTGGREVPGQVPPGA